MTRSLVTSCVLLFFVFSAPIWGQDSEQKFELHGFGGWAYGSTDGYDYTLGTEDGKYTNAQFSLHVVAFPSDDLTIVAQVQFDNGTDEVDLDYAFAEWFVSDAFKLRFGRVKHPFGIYGEIFDVGTLRPFHSLPQGIYGGQGVTAEAYNGIGLTGTHQIGDRWSLQHDFYVGQITGTVVVPPGLSLTPGTAPPLEATVLDFEFDDVLGMRLNFQTPIDGLSFGASGYTSSGAEDPDVPIPGFDTEKRGQEVIATHVEYVGGKTWVRAEAVQTITVDDIQQDTSYLELAYKLTPKWQIAARYEDWKAKIPGLNSPLLPNFIRQLANHEETAMGINYWMSSSLVLRASFHDVRGNRFAFPSDPQEILMALFQDNLDEKTHLIVLGTQFSF